MTAMAMAMAMATTRSAVLEQPEQEQEDPAQRLVLWDESEAHGRQGGRGGRAGAGEWVVRQVSGAEWRSGGGETPISAARLPLAARCRVMVALLLHTRRRISLHTAPQRLPRPPVCASSTVHHASPCCNAHDDISKSALDAISATYTSAATAPVLVGALAVCSLAASGVCDTTYSRYECSYKYLCR